jgi:hypothetical protein
MRSRMNDVSSTKVCQWALDWLLQAELLKADGYKCTPTLVWSMILRAAAHTISVFAACRDVAQAPSSQAIFDCLLRGLPKTRLVLERRLNESLTNSLPRSLRRRTWRVAIDWHLVPYYGEHQQSRNELYRSRAQSGTTTFHAYATACIVDCGQRYTLALTDVRQHESANKVLARLLDRIEQLGLKIKHVLLDAAFYNLAVVEFLQARKLPFIMPAVIRGRKPKRGTKKTGLRAIEQRGAGWYQHTLRRGEQQATVSICVSYRTYQRAGKKARQNKKLLFAVWKVTGTTVEIREQYRLRFGIEASYRQRRQARIYTCTRDPRVRLVFVAVSLLLRNLWVWVHATRLSQTTASGTELRLELLRFQQLLDWINRHILDTWHDHSLPKINLSD